MKWRRWIPAFAGVYGSFIPQFIVLILLGFCSALFEVVGIGLVIPLFSQGIAHTQPGTDAFSVFIVKIFALLHLPFGVRGLLLFIVGLFVLKAIALIGFSYAKVHLISTYELRTRDALYRGTLKTFWGYLIRQKIGFVENVLMTDLGMTIGMLKQTSSFILIFTSLLLYATAAFSIAPFVTFVTLSIGAVIMLFYHPLIRRTRILAKQQSLLNKRIAHHVNEHVAGLKVVKAMGAEKPIAAMARELFVRMKENRIKFFFLREASSL